jgi:hypothetical protein
MAGLGGFALGAAPIAGGALLGVAAGKLKAPDFRGLIKQDLDLLDRIPHEQTARRAELQRTIDARIDDLIAANDKSRALRQAAASYQGSWRDIVVFVCVVLFTMIWWDVSHDRTNWLPMFIILIALSVLTAAYALRGLFTSLSNVVRRHDRRRQPERSSHA